MRPGMVFAALLVLLGVACSGPDGAPTTEEPPATTLATTPPTPTVSATTTVAVATEAEVELPAAVVPSARGYHHMTEADELGVMLCCGWDTVPPLGGRPQQDFWAFGPSTTSDPPGWYQLVAPSQARIEDGALTYDSESGRVILHAITETWAYDPASGTWENLRTEEMPTDVSGGRMVYDTESDRVILFGGQPPGVPGANNDTWAFDYQSRAWTKMDPAQPPRVRFWPGMAYDQQSDRVILFSGRATSATSDTWAYDYNTNTWTEMSPTLSPPAREYTQMVYVPVIDRVILFGGGHRLS